MIQKLEISAIHSKLTPKKKEYVEDKIGHLDKFVSPKARESMHAEVKLKQLGAKDKIKHGCEVIIFLPHGQLTVNARGSSIEAAIDEAEAKLKIQLKKYKAKHAGPGLRKRMVNILSRSR